MPPPLETVPLAGLSLIGPDHPGFDPSAIAILGRAATLILQLKPMLAMVRNDSAETVVAFSTVWRIGNREGRQHTIRDHTSFHAGLCGDIRRPYDRALAAGQLRLVAPGLVVHGWADVDPFYDTWITSHLSEQREQLADARSLVVELNAAIFADGRITGPDDDGWLEGLFAAHVREKQRWYRMIRDATADGQSIAEAFAPIESDLQASTAEGARGDLHRHMAATEAAAWRFEHGDARVSASIPTLKLEPFKVYR